LASRCLDRAVCPLHACFLPDFLWASGHTKCNQEATAPSYCGLLPRGTFPDRTERARAFVPSHRFRFARFRLGGSMGSGTYPLGNGLRHSLTVIDSPIAGRVLSDQRDDHCLIMKVGVGGAFVAAEHPPAYGEPVTLRIGAGPSAFE